VAKLKVSQKFADPDRGALFTPRFVIALLLIILGIAWMFFYYIAVRADPTVAGSKAGGPHFIADLKKWNYVIGFGLILIGLLMSANKGTPLGRDRGVVIGMVGCFLIGLLWICTYYVISGDQLPNTPVFNDLGQWNLLVGIGFMSVGFAFATKWE
jgi:drug/metabolite transporter (DMT)-like permease